LLYLAGINSFECNDHYSKILQKTTALGSSVIFSYLTS